MLKIQSEEVNSKANIVQVHTFLNNLNNFKHLFPKDKILQMICRFIKIYDIDENFFLQMYNYLKSFMVAQDIF